MRPFSIVEDRGFPSLMKTGRPEHYLPSRFTVSRDVKDVFVKVRKRIGEMLQVNINRLMFRNSMLIYYQEYDGLLSFATDAWTSPNSKAYIAITVHLEQNGVPLCTLLDLVEVRESHSGTNLASAFAQILCDFGISNKVSNLFR